MQKATPTESTDITLNQGYIFAKRNKTRWRNEDSTLHNGRKRTKG